MNAKELSQRMAGEAAAIAQYPENGFTLVTADKGFKRIKDLSLILIEL